MQVVSDLFVHVEVSGDKMLLAYEDETPVEMLDTYYEVARKHGWDVLEQYWDTDWKRYVMTLGKAVD